jgi:hypothetical protein
MKVAMGEASVMATIFYRRALFVYAFLILWKVGEI